MSFNLGNSDRLPAIGGTNANNNKNPLQQAINSSNSKYGADMIVTPDHPSWHADHSSHSSAQESSQQNAQRNTGGQSGPGAPYTGGRANTGNTGPFRAGPDHDSYLPPNAVPQGARFDPIVPENVRQGLPNRNAAGHQQGQGRPGQNQEGFASGEPDYDELLPPN
ncbi:hypothetical protein K457DRAFT_133122 [Linnemannia elongata AG-77]|uniref:Uncharacterized protein n=1 Tax=Linnemannia elongata AG-77 TaxID=1314771 RepID=A0A197KF47_9FUNG|nr:hypothetical protein K457DRAFT_133122 [Linnemannia elongata AG-77]